MLVLSSGPFDELILKSLFRELPLKNSTSSGVFMKIAKTTESKSQNWEFLLFCSGFSLVVGEFLSF